MLAMEFGEVFLVSLIVLIVAIVVFVAVVALFSVAVALHFIVAVVAVVDTLLFLRCCYDCVCYCWAAAIA